MARRVNSKFLIIFSAVVLLGVASAFLIGGPLQNLFKGDRSRKLIAQGDGYLNEANAANITTADKKEKLVQAASCFQQATGSDAKNLELWIKLGDTYDKLTQHDIVSYIDASRKSWERALEVDPGYLPALRRLEQSYYQETQINPVAFYFTRLEEKATAIHKLEPNDLKSYSRLLISPINQWLANIGTPPEKVNASVEELATLIGKHPTAPEIGDMVFFAAAAKVRQGVELKKTSQDQQGNNLIAAGNQMFVEAIKANDKDANLHYRYFELLTVLAAQDTDNKDRAAGYRAAQRAELQRARELVKPEDGQLFVKANIAAHQLELQDRQPDRAERILLDLQAARPDDQRIRLVLAKLMKGKPERLNEAISLLEQPIVDSGFTGVEAKMKGELEVQTWSELANMYVERYQVLKPEERAEELKKIEQKFQQIQSKVGERSFVLKLRGKLELLRGGPDAPVKAIDTFERAQNAYRVEKNGQEDLDLVFLLARAYFASRQTTQAKQQLSKFKQRLPDYSPVRTMLAQVLIAEGDIAGAREDVNYLEKILPEDPEVLRLVLATLRPEETVKAKATFASLPERTRMEKLLKAQIAPLPPVNSLDESARLFKELLTADPGDFDAANGMKEVYVRKGDKAAAMEVLKTAQAAKPAEERFSLVIQELGGASEVQLAKISDEMIRKTYAKDPLALNIKLYELELYGRRNPTAANREAAFNYLKTAEGLKPDDLRVLDLMFQHYLAARDWDKAEEYAKRLGDKNADQAHGLIYKFRLAMARQNIELANSISQELTKDLPYFARSWVMRGQALQAAQQFDLAITNGYSMALDKQSENPEALAGIIDCYYRTNRPADAGRFIEVARKAHPSNLYFKDLWTRHNMQYGEPSLVIEPLRQDRDANPLDADRWVALGRAQYAAASKADPKAKEYTAAAKETFKEALKKFPADRRPYMFLAEIANGEGQLPEGERLLKELAARAEFKDSPEAQMLIADNYLKTNKAEQAEATMKQAVEQFKGKPAEVDVRRRLAAYYTQRAKYAEALALLDPSSPDALVRQQIVEIYMLSGSKEGPDSPKFVAAERLLRGLLDGAPKDAQLHALLGVVLLNMKKETQAVESMTTALTLEPKNQAALFSRGQLRLQSKPPQLDEAIRDLTLLRDVNPNHTEARVSLAEALRLKGQLEPAERELEEALRHAPNRRDVRMTLAGLYAGARPPQWAEAERVIMEGQRVDATETIWHRMLSKMYSVRGQHDKAAVSIRTAIDLDAKNAAAAAAAKLPFTKNGELIREYFDVLETGKNWDQLLTEANGFVGQDPTTANRIWWLWAKRAVALSNKGDKQGSMTDFEKAMNIVQADKELNQDSLIFIIDKIKENLGAGPAIARVLALADVKGGGPDVAEKAARWKIVLAYLYYQNKESAKATQTIQKAIEECQALTNADVRKKLLISALNVGGTLYMMNEEGTQFEQARAAYDQLLALRNDDLGALNNLACLMAEHTTPRDMDKAIAYSNKAVEVMKSRKIEEPNVLDTHGWVLVLSGGTNIDKGIEKLHESIKAGEIPEAHYHLGEAYLIKGIPEAAKRALDKANQMIYDKRERKELYDEKLKPKIEDALVRAEKALLKAQ